MTAHLTLEQKQTAHRLKAKGLTQLEIARDLGCKAITVRACLRGSGKRAAKSFGWTPRAGRLSIDEREEILVGVRKGESLSAIARRLGRAPSTVTREVAANGGVDGYGAWRGHRRAAEQTKRPKVAKLSHPPLVAVVSTWLEALWSPEVISARLRAGFGDDPMMQVSHETIYQSLFVQGRGELRRELARHLRTGRTSRKTRVGVHRGSTIADMVMISERPAEVADRAVPGHWEGDLITGKKNQSAVGTLVERTSRLVLLLHLPKGDHGANAVEAAMKEAIATLPGELVRSITWDQGSEMNNHVSFTIATGIPIYFCDPHSPWQRGSNENTNGLLRQYMPKGTDLSLHSAEDLRGVSRSLNTRPRKSLNYMTPLERFAELVALTT
jgi:IS30 family transposase